jgi:hypothetical protein
MADRPQPHAGERQLELGRDDAKRILESFLFANPNVVEDNFADIEEIIALEEKKSSYANLFKSTFQSFPSQQLDICNNFYLK